MGSDRTAVFVDAAYLEQVALKEFGGARIAYRKLAPTLCTAKDDLLRTYYYNCPPFVGDPPTSDQLERKRKADAFYDKLRAIPRFELRLGRLAVRRCEKCSYVYYQQKRADVMLSVDLVNLSARNQITKAILVAGDSDFLPAVRVAKDCGVVVHLYHGGKMNPPHDDLREACDERSVFTKALMDAMRWS